MKFCQLNIQTLHLFFHLRLMKYKHVLLYISLVRLHACYRNEIIRLKLRSLVM
jgi:hypothetical protein